MTDIIKSMPSISADQSATANVLTAARSAPAASSTAVGGDVPAGLRCKITGAILQDAVLAEDGYTYNQSAWQAHVQQHPHTLRSPVTHQPVSALAVPNRNLKTIAAEWNIWQAAQPPHAEVFDMERWIEDPFTREVMREPVVLPDGMVCDKETARKDVFNHALHPGRSFLDENFTFDREQKLLRDLNLLELSEAVLGCAPGTLPRTYVIPTIASMLPRPALHISAASGGNLAPRAVAGVPQAPQQNAAGPVKRAVITGAWLGVALTSLATGVSAASGALDKPMGREHARDFGAILCVLALLFAIQGLVVCQHRGPVLAAPAQRPDAAV